MTTSGLIQANKIPSFFIAGGTLGLDSPSYVIRPADEELFSAVLAGKFCYVLTARQMGKSSLMVRTTQRLQKEKVKTATVDLTNIGTIGLTIDQWYTGLLDSLSRQLHVPLDVPKWWRQHQSLGQIPRFTRFLRNEILAKVPEPIAIFIDEVDSTLGLSFSDDFFAAIRAIHNARATETIYDRLTFILLGTAAPTDLMKDLRRTPFNIGKRIDLPPFKLSEEQKLENLRQGLEEVYPGEGSNIFDRIFYWTSGHPYLTQKLCLAIVEKKSEHQSGWTKPQIDAIVQRIFLSATEKPDVNIQILVDRLRKHPKSADLLRLYQEVLEKDAVPDDEQSYLHEQLKLIGIVRAEDGLLVVYNRIYKNIFDKKWLTHNFDQNEFVFPKNQTIEINFESKHTQQNQPKSQSVYGIRRYKLLLIALGILAGFILVAIVLQKKNFNDGIETPVSNLIPMPSAASLELSTTATSFPTATKMLRTPVGPTNTITAIPTSTLTPTPTQTSTNTPTPQGQAIAIQNASVRIFPDPASLSFGEVNEGDIVQIIGHDVDNNWLYILADNGNEGYAISNLFQWSGDFDSLPIKQPKYAIVAFSISIFEGDSTDTPVVFIPIVGDLLEVLGRSESGVWLYVKYIRNDNEYFGYVPLSRLEYQGNTDSLDIGP